VFEDQPYIEYLKSRRYDGEEEEDDDDDDVSSEDDYYSNAPEDEVEGNQNEKQNDGKSTDASNPHSNVRLFMKGMTGDEDSLEDYDQVDEVASFCEARPQRALYRKHVALLDERNIGGTIVDKKGHCRTRLKPLALQKLCDKLSKKVTQSHASIRTREN